jgi:hypothetical protein
MKFKITLFTRKKWLFSIVIFYFYTRNVLCELKRTSDEDQILKQPMLSEQCKETNPEYVKVSFSSQVVSNGKSQHLILK